MKNPVLNAFYLCLALTLPIRAFADAQITSWYTANSGQYARIYGTTSERSSGTSATTWTKQSVPAYADISQVLYSGSWVYVRASDLPSYISGPWLTPQGTTGQFSPTNQHLINRFPRSPSVQSGTKTISGTGYSGLYVDGIAIFNFTDGKAWDPTNLVIASGPHNQSTFFWHRNAPVGEGYNFDYGLGHQNPSGVYHTHQQPIALRYQLGDHIDYNSSTKNYSESSGTNLTHSPIIGWAYDGYPIYGPYGYSISNDASSGIRRMVSGYVQRDGKNGTDNLTNNLTTIPAWYARFRVAHFGSSSTNNPQTRPSLSGTNYLGTFAEDYDYYGDITNPATSLPYVMGTNTFDLDVYNGRYCVTPEFPGGTYAYFLDIDSSGTSTYPYAIAYEYYGTASGGSVNSIAEAVTTNFDGAEDSALTLATPTVNTNYVVTLAWSSTEGGTYKIESSTNQTTWTIQNSGVSAASDAVSTTTNYTSTVTGGTGYVRVTRTALATFDPTGGDSGIVAQTNVVSFSLGNTAPVVANPIPNQTNTYGLTFSYTFSSNTFTDADSGQTLTYTASGSVLTNTGISFNTATRTFSATTVDATNGGTITGSYTVTVVATDNGVPALSATNTFTLTINKAVASVTAGNASRVYGGNNPTFTGLLGGFVAADSIAENYTCAAATNSNAGTYAINPSITDPGSRLGNYNVTTNSGLLAVTQAVLTVSANSTTRVYGATNPIFSANYSGFTNAQTLATSGVTGSPTLTTGVATNSSIGSYTVTNAIGTLSAANYSFALANGTLTITQAALSVTASNASRVYGVTNPVFTGLLTGITVGDNLTASYTSTATTNNSPGNYTISPVFSDPNNRLGNYLVTTNTGTLTISKATLGVTANNAARSYGVTNPAFAVTYSGFANGETSASGTISGSPALTTAATTNSSLGTYTVTNLIGSLISSDYTFLFTNGTLTVTQANLTVSANSYSRAYGITNPILSGTLSGLQNNDAITANYSTIATTNSPVGSYNIAVTLNDPGSKLGNYLVTTNTGTLTVTNLGGTDNYQFTILVTNAVVPLATNNGGNITVTDPNSGLSVTVALTMTPLSTSNASPVFDPLDFYGPNQSPVHAAINSSVNDGNWIDWYESIRFGVKLSSASSGIDTNTVKFGIADIGIRSNGGTLAWASTAGTNFINPNAEALFPLDTTPTSLAGTNYSGLLHAPVSTGQYQLTDTTGVTGAGIVFSLQFYVGTNSVISGTNATLSTATYANGHFTFSVTGTTGANYIILTTTNLSTGTTWTPLLTNTAPFTYTNTAPTAAQQYYRALAQ